MPVWLTFDFRFWGKWPLKWNFLKLSFWIRRQDTEYVSLPNLVKLAVAKFPKGPLDYLTKNSSSTEIVPAPILPKMDRSPPKFPERCHPLTCPRVANLVRIGCILPDLFRKDWFFRPKKSIQYRLSACNKWDALLIDWPNSGFDDLIS